MTAWYLSSWSLPVMLKFNRVALSAVAAAAALAATGPAAAVPRWAPMPRCARPASPPSWSASAASRSARGRVAIKLYASNPTTFLEKGKYLRKVDVPVARRRRARRMCPGAASGRYALSVRHEVGAKKSRSDGGGFSGNPPLSLLDVVLKRKPSLARVSFGQRRRRRSCRSCSTICRAAPSGRSS